MMNKGAGHFLVELNPEVEKKVDEALILLDNGKTAKAKNSLASLLKLHPANHSVHYGMGCIYAFSQKPKESIPYFKKAVEIYPYFVEAWHNLGTAYRSVGVAHHSITCARKVIVLGDPTDAYVQNCREHISTMSKHIAKLGLTLDQFIANAELFDQSFAHFENEEITLAKQGFLKVLLIEKDHVQTHGNLALCYAKLGEKDKALSHIDKALELDPNYEVARSNRPIIEAMAAGKKLTNLSRTVEFYSTGMSER